MGRATFDGGLKWKVRWPTYHTARRCLHVKDFENKALPYSVELLTQDATWKPPPPGKRENEIAGQGHEEMVHKLAIPTMDGINYIELADIVALHAEGSYTRVYCENGDRHLVSHNIGKVEQVLPSSHFYRCHRTHVINLRKVAKLMRTGGCRALLVTAWSWKYHGAIGRLWSN